MVSGLSLSRNNHEFTLGCVDGYHRQYACTSYQYPLTGFGSQTLTECMGQ